MLGEWNIAPHILNFGTGWGCVVSFTPQPLYPPIPIKKNTSWAIEPVWRRWQRKNCPCRESNSSRPACSLVSLLTEVQECTNVKTGGHMELCVTDRKSEGIGIGISWYGKGKVSLCLIKHHDMKTAQLTAKSRPLELDRLPSNS
jgi:hypothetical protein